jgi:ABC-type xylose transport system substrate-binding protein
MTVFKDSARLAQAAATLTDQLLNGREIDIPDAQLATGDLAKIGYNGKITATTWLLDPIAVTKQNFDVPVKAGFYSDAQAAILLKSGENDSKK